MYSLYFKKKINITHHNWVNCALIVFEYFVVMSETAFRARDVGLRAQKKILSRMAGKSIARALIDDVTASLLDNLYRLAKQYVSMGAFIYLLCLLVI